MLFFVLNANIIKADTRRGKINGKIVALCAKKCIFVAIISAKKCNSIYGKNCISKTYRVTVQDR